MPASPAIMCIAHRGASTVMPENTVAAFDEAIRLNARAVEFDVHLSADGIPVVIHDDTLDRTTTGRGYVSSHTAFELRRFDAGSWLHQRFAGIRIPTLDEALRAIAPHAIPVIELKTAIPIPLLLDILKQRDALEHAIILSYDRAQLSALRHASRDLLLGLNADYFSPQLPEEAHHLGANILDLPTEKLTVEVVQSIRDAALEPWTFTPNDIGTIAACAAMGVSGIITDRPDLIRPRPDGSL
jgi:glycerophosphoryl diester phosphodiesterase